MEFKVDDPQWIQETIEDYKFDPSKYELPFTGKDEFGHNVMFEVYSQYILQITFLEDGRARYSQFYPDGRIEETYRR